MGRDGWDDFGQVERAVVVATAVVIGAASLVGGAIGWIIGQLTHHLLHEDRSDHRR